jgi:predicted membrane-bound spermidine synthase
MNRLSLARFLAASGAISYTAVPVAAACAWASLISVAPVAEILGVSCAAIFLAFGLSRADTAETLLRLAAGKEEG